MRLIDYFEEVEQRRRDNGHEPIVAISSVNGADVRRLSLNSLGGHIGAIEWSHRRITVAVADLYGRIQSPNDWRTIRHPVASDPTGALRLGVDTLTDLVGKTRARRIAGVGIAVAAPVDPFSRAVRRLDTNHGTALDGSWVDIDPIAEVAQRLDDWQCGITAANDANLAAWDEFAAASARWTHEPPLQNLVHVRWGTGVGAGLILNGKIYAGAQGLAGEIGHQKVFDIDGQDRPPSRCPRCGLDVCLENVIGYERVREQLGVDASVSRHDVDRDERAQEILSRFAIYLGRALAGPVAAFNPQMISISGPSAIPQLEEPLVRRLREGLASATVPATCAAIREISVVHSRWEAVDDHDGKLAVVAGAIRRSRHYDAHRYILRELGVSDRPDGLGPARRVPQARVPSLTNELT